MTNIPSGIPSGIPSDIPAGWYDDPEDSSQQRYWNGETWTDEKAPKAPEPERSQKPIDIISEGYQLAKESWKGLFVIGLILLAAMVLVGVIMVTAIMSALEPGVFDIIDRVTEPNWDPAQNPSDRAFEDSISLDTSAVFVSSVVVSGVLFASSLLLVLGGWTLHLTAARAGQPKTASESLRLAFRGLPRWLGRSLLWLLIATVSIGLLTFVVNVGGGILGLLFVPLVIFIWPYIHLASVAFFVTPDDVSPLRSVISLLDGSWRPIAMRSLLASLVLTGVFIVAVFINIIPFIGSLIGFALLIFMYMLAVAISVSLYGWADGPVANDSVRAEP